jgi:DNA-binding transcriptional LysR family regulator
MDLRQLRYFTVLAETLNFHRAAERLNMSQPPLTVAIRKLETDLGVALFERNPRGLRLTEAGMAARGPARAALIQAEQVREAARQGAVGLRGRLVVGFIGSAVAQLLPGIVSPFRKAYAEVDLVLEEMTSVEIMEAIAVREIDIGLVRLPVLNATPVAMDVIDYDSLIAAVPDGDVPEDATAIHLAALKDRPFIMYAPISVLHSTIRLACQTAGFVPQVSQEATQVQTILSMVQAGLGVALVPAKSARFAPAGVRLVPLSEPIPIETGLVRALDAGPLAENFARAAIAICDSVSISHKPK